MARIPLQVGDRQLETGGVIQVSTADPIGAAVAGFGKQVADVGMRALERQHQAEQFNASMSFNAFRESTTTDLTTAQQTMPPGATGFSQGFMVEYDRKAKAWLNTLPTGARPEFQQRLDVQREIVFRETAKLELKERQSYEVRSISERMDAASNSVMQGGAGSLPVVEADLNELIDRSSLTHVQREEQKRAVKARLQEVGFRSLPAEDQQRVAKGWGFGNTFTGTAVDRTMQILRDKEGFRSSTYWDVNAHRVGFGSDTVTDAAGNVRSVRQGDTVTRDDAERDLRRRTGETLASIQQKVGADAFGRLNANQQAALASVAYNYGSLPDNVSLAVQGGNAELIAQSIEGLQGHNGGVNRNRRLSEAALARSAGDGPVIGAYQPDSRFDAVPPERRFVLAGAADAAMKRQAVREAETAVQTYNEQFNALQTNIIDGKANLADVEKARQDGWLRDAGDIQRVMSQIATRDKGMADRTNFSRAFSDPTFQWNPVDGNHKDWAEAGFQSLGGNLAALETVASKTGMVPASAATALRGALFSPDPQQVQNALQVTANLVGGRYPDIFAGVDNGKELTDAALSFRHYAINRGLGADGATRKIMEERTPEYQRTVQAKIKSEDMNAIVKKNLSESDIRSAFDTSWLPFTDPQLTFSPEMRVRAMGDYEEAFREKYAQVGNVQLAKNQALDDMKRTWGVTQISGTPTVMKFAPEKSSAYAGIENVGERIAAEAIVSIKDWNGAVVDRSKLRLDEVKATGDRFNQGEAPTYLLSYSDQNGHIQTIPKLFYADPELMREQQTEERRLKFEFEAHRHRVMEAAPTFENQVKWLAWKLIEVRRSNQAAIAEMTSGPDGIPAPTGPVDAYDRLPELKSLADGFRSIKDAIVNFPENNRRAIKEMSEQK